MDSFKDAAAAGRDPGSSRGREQRDGSSPGQCQPGPGARRPHPAVPKPRKSGMGSQSPPVHPAFGGGEELRSDPSAFPIVFPGSLQPLSGTEAGSGLSAGADHEPGTCLELQRARNENHPAEGFPALPAAPAAGWQMWDTDTSLRSRRRHEPSRAAETPQRRFSCFFSCFSASPGPIRARARPDNANIHGPDKPRLCLLPGMFSPGTLQATKSPSSRCWVFLSSGKKQNEPRVEEWHPVNIFLLLVLNGLEKLLESKAVPAVLVQVPLQDNIPLVRDAKQGLGISLLLQDRAFRQNRRILKRCLRVLRKGCCCSSCSSQGCVPALRDAAGSTEMRESGNFPQPGVGSTTGEWDPCDSSLSSSSATGGGTKEPNPLGVWRRRDIFISWLEN